MSTLGYIYIRSYDNGGNRSSLLRVQPTAQGGVATASLVPCTDRHISETEALWRDPYHSFGGILAQRCFFVNRFYEKLQTKIHNLLYN